MAIGWFVTFVILLGIELCTVNLVSIWFAAGALVAMLSSYLFESFLVQLAIFIVVSLITLFITKPLIRKIKGDKVTPTNLDRVIGKTAVVTKNIDKNNYGEVRVLGNTWTAEADTKILKDEKVKVLAIDGVKLIVEKEEE